MAVDMVDVENLYEGVEAIMVTHPNGLMRRVTCVCGPTADEIDNPNSMWECCSSDEKLNCTEYNRDGTRRQEGSPNENIVDFGKAPME